MQTSHYAVTKKDLPSTLVPLLPQSALINAAQKALQASPPSAHVCFFSGRRVRGLQTSSCAEKQSSWFLPLTLATMTAV